ncbi:MAG TPA: hypothetical protein VMW95_04015 [Desulfobacterales bacterium]|nr:hypothetical protein [Desulfobacterales bacterium]
MKILIIGNGVVGNNMHKLFPDADIHDPAKNIFAAYNFYDIGFICVPTEKKEDGTCDISIVQHVITEFSDRCRVLCIRSTVPPGFTETYKDKCIFQPEYYGGTQHANHNDYDFIILGGSKSLSGLVAEAYKNIYTGSLRILKTDSRTAEVCKYMENSWLALKVTFCNEFYRLAKKLNIDYDELRELWLADPRINRSHTFSYMEHPFYSSHCLNKDIPAIIKAAEFSGIDMQLMKAVMETNENHKNDPG